MDGRIEVVSIDGAGGDLVADGLRSRSAPGGPTIPLHLVVPREDWVAQRSHDARALVILRDPRDLVVLPDAGASSTPAARLLADLNDRERAIARMADLRIVERTLRSWAGTPPSAQEQVVSFEALCARPETLGDAVRRLGAEWTLRDQRALERELAGFRTEPWATIGHWRDRFDPTLGALFETMFPGLLRDLGYEESDEWWQALGDAETDGAEPARRSIFGTPTIKLPPGIQHPEAADGRPVRPGDERSTSRPRLGLFGREAS